jgi:1-acyl-sn-glycerol-3-phosphate acyltransferase
MYRLWLGFRSVIFYILYAGFTAFFSLLCVSFIYLLPYHQRVKVIVMWNRVIVLSLKLVCGVHYRVHGMENIPNQPYVALSKHQSAWETFYLVDHLQPVSTILKQELLKIPGFGWGLRLLKPIPIDRKNPREALKTIRRVGLQRLTEEKIPVLIFPEGTRTAVGGKGSYARSGAALAIEAGVPVVLIAHNAGYFWPTTHWIKSPGVIDVFVSEPIATDGLNATELTKQAELWIEAHVKVPNPLPVSFQ